MNAQSDPATDNKNLKAFLQRPKADLVVEKLINEVLEALAREPQNDSAKATATRQELLSIILPLAVQTNDTEAFRKILQMREFAALDLVKGCYQMLNYNLGYGLLRELDGSVSNKNPKAFLMHMADYLKENPALANPEFKKSAILLTNGMLDHAILWDNPSYFQTIFQQLVKSGSIAIKDINPKLLISIIELDRVNFIQVLKDCGFPKEKFLELAPDYNFLHKAAKEGKSSLVSEFLKVFQPSAAEVNGLTKPKILLVTPFFGNRSGAFTPAQSEIKQHQFTALELAVHHNHPEVITAIKDSIDFSKPFTLPQKWPKLFESDPSKAESEAPIMRLCYKTLGKKDCLKALLDIVKERLGSTTSSMESFAETKLSEKEKFGFSISDPQKKEMQRLEKMVSLFGKEFYRDFFASVTTASKAIKDFHQKNDGVTGDVANATATKAATQNTRVADQMLY